MTAFELDGIAYERPWNAFVGHRTVHPRYLVDVLDEDCICVEDSDTEGCLLADGYRDLSCKESGLPRVGMVLGTAYRWQPGDVIYVPGGAA